MTATNFKSLPNLINSSYMNIEIVSDSKMFLSFFRRNQYYYSFNNIQTDLSAT